MAEKQLYVSVSPGDLRPPASTGSTFNGEPAENICGFQSTFLCFNLAQFTVMNAGCVTADLSHTHTHIGAHTKLIDYFSKSQLETYARDRRRKSPESRPADRRGGRETGMRGERERRKVKTRCETKRDCALYMRG